ncbi:VapE domain-containing protein [Pseudacidovorax sp. RU35E]|uniref:VapE domain-containing protein n=1 Tax=Pseudacidovorax sp. RU35E TaxID=1907403 RepID=UPI00095572CB|nr:VapE domain-containing protein [Pseudacidovorax sp. RU35E]SIR00293.1 Predicted P-loop ATPase and inactivated derivatives [Pseudacidovorax sp. RU35E]
MTSREPLPPINYGALGKALLPMAETLLPQWLPGGHRRGPEYVCGSVAGGKGRSFSVNVITGKWSDFAANDKKLTGGDLVGLYGAIHGLENWEAALELADQFGLHDIAGIVKRGKDVAAPRPPPSAPVATASAQPDKERWTPIVPVPPHAAQPTFWHYERKNPVHRAAYRVDGDLFGFVVRFIDSSGRKVTMPYVYASSDRDGSQKWQWRGWEEPRPLFYPSGQQPGARTVIVVEGEIKAEVLQALLDAHAPGIYCVVSWPNGSKSWRMADWSWLAASTVLLWPDCDSKRVQLTKQQRQECGGDEARLAEAMALQPFMAAREQPGMAAMLGIGALLRDTHGCAVSMLPCEPPGVLPDGWDARDAIEVDGWGFDEVMAFFARATVLTASTPSPPPPPPGPPPPASDGPADAGGDDEDDGIPTWLEPFYDFKRRSWRVSRSLVIAALENDPKLQGCLGRNLLSSRIDVLKPWPWPHGEAGALSRDADLMLGDYFTSRYGIPSISRPSLYEAMETVASKCRFHPVRQYLEGLQHDEKPRLDSWLIYVIGEKPETLTESMTRYLRLVGRFWLLGMVYRVMQPGCKFDYCPVLEGKGGLRKTTMVEALASTDWYSATPFDVGKGKEGQEQVQGVWCYELGELAGFGKAAIQLIKAFISEKVDRYRAAYARDVEAFPRQCVMVGTTNEKTYLRDRTGNRRFWPIPVRHQINTDWIVRNRDQLFAEAMAFYRKGERYAPTPQEEAELFVPRQELRMVETTVQSELLRLLTRDPDGTESGKVINNLAEFVTLGQLTKALGADPAKSGAGLDREVAGWMEAEGWERCKKQINGVRAWGYLRPRDWPPESRQDDEEEFVQASHGSQVDAPRAPAAPAPARNQGPHDQWGADDEPF